MIKHTACLEIKHSETARLTKAELCTNKQELEQKH